jgi:hypothetical protein
MFAVDLKCVIFPPFFTVYIYIYMRYESKRI